jgi:hypothetical protein
VLLVVLVVVLLQMHLAVQEIHQAPALHKVTMVELVRQMALLKPALVVVVVQVLLVQMELTVE